MASGVLLSGSIEVVEILNILRLKLSINRLMKRTKEAFFREHPEWQQTAGLSGVTFLEG